MPKNRNKEEKERDEENILEQNASGNGGQSTGGKNNVSPRQKEDVDVDKINRINQSRRGYYSRNGHGGYRGL